MTTLQNGMQTFGSSIAHEYGPTTFRPHLHGIYYFDDPRIEACFSEAIHSCWQNGDTSAANIFSNGGFSYVAQYVNMSVHLPSFYSHKDLRQRHQFSKCPPLGFDSLLLESLRQLYSERPTYRTVWDSSSARYVTLPVNSTFKDRYFPKCPGYSKSLILVELDYIEQLNSYLPQTLTNSQKQSIPFSAVCALVNYQRSHFSQV